MNQRLMFEQLSCTSSPLSINQNNHDRRQRFLKQYKNQEIQRQSVKSLIQTSDIQVSPRVGEANLNLKKIQQLIKVDQLNEANIMIEELMNNDKNQLSKSILSQIYYHKGVISQKQDLYDIAAVYFQQSIDFDTTNIKSAYSLASCENLRGNFAKALDDYTYALDAEQFSQSRRHMNHVGSLSRLRLSNELLQSFPDKQVFDKIQATSPSPNDELLNSDKIKVQLHRISSGKDIVKDYRKFFANMNVDRDHRESVQSPISFNGDGYNFQEYINQIGNFDEEEKRFIDKQKSKELQEKVFEDLTQMIIRKKSPPNRRGSKDSQEDAQSNQEYNQTNMIKRMYLNPKKQQTTQVTTYLKKQQKNYRYQKENYAQDHFKKEGEGQISSGEVSSITPQSNSNNTSRISQTNTQNATQQFNNSIRNLSSMSILKQINKVQKSQPLNSSSLSKSSSQNTISSFSMTKKSIPSPKNIKKYTNALLSKNNILKEKVQSNKLFSTKNIVQQQKKNAIQVIQVNFEDQSFRTTSNQRTNQRIFSPLGTFNKENNKKTTVEPIMKTIQVISPNKYQAFFLRGLVYFKQRNIQQAMMDFQQSQNLNNQNAQAFLYLIETSQADTRNFKYYVLQAQFYSSSEQSNKYFAIEKARICIEESLELRSSHDKTLLLRAFIYKRLDMFEQAIEDLKSIKSEKIIINRNLNFEIALCYISIDDYQNAVQYLQRQVQFFIDNPQLLGEQSNRNLVVKIVQKIQQIAVNNDLAKFDLNQYIQDIIDLPQFQTLTDLRLKLQMLMLIPNQQQQN
ncbi:tpr domain containing protein [Stylonychia lemnae]|uniref:Tpr domain containing protein n=1 Tax=Stylonychia lemnae TaxID=5949 RepID=A0A077ZU24_STYLE|nr:tpr domain containing protein [Stylonychia lemnae]|eukprot:CDW71956.1 tpr domain containing protein [Stylonychia lemnae]